MTPGATHTFLVKKPDYLSGRERVLSFFAGNFLVRYDSVQVVRERSFNADHQGFWDTIERGVDLNQQVIANLLRELQESGFKKISDLSAMPRGYQSKTLHIVTHLLDGFFGIDSHFYNLEEDSHGLSEKLSEEIRKQPHEFWVLTVACAAEAGNDPNLLDKIRKFESDF